MTYSIISKGLAIGLLLTSFCSSVAFADQDLGDQNVVQGHDSPSMITEDQQRRWEMKMLSWQQNLADSLQEKIGKTLLLNNNMDYQQDLSVFSAELTGDRGRIVQK